TETTTIITLSLHDALTISTLSVYLNESQIEELAEHVEINDYVEFMTMDEWNDYQSGTPATEILESIDISDFDTGDTYAVMDSLGDRKSTRLNSSHDSI